MVRRPVHTLIDRLDPAEIRVLGRSDLTRLLRTGHAVPEQLQDRLCGYTVAVSDAEDSDGELVVAGHFLGFGAADAKYLPGGFDVGG
jgi:hypothetical protein